MRSFLVTSCSYEDTYFDFIIISAFTDLDPSSTLCARSFSSLLNGGKPTRSFNSLRMKFKNPKVNVEKG
jgi:hypothetical protein